VKYAAVVISLLAALGSAVPSLGDERGSSTHALILAEPGDVTLLKELSGQMIGSGPDFPELGAGSPSRRAALGPSSVAAAWLHCGLAVLARSPGATTDDPYLA
jgi:hypothetical protein